MNIRSTIIALLLVSSICAAQVAPKETAAPSTQKSAEFTPKKDADSAAKQAAPPPATNVPEDAVVITVPGACPAGTPAADCSTKITRGDFERLLNAMNPNIPAEARRSIASSYAQLLTLASEAQKMGLDKDPKVQIQMHVQGMSLLAQALQKKMVEESKPTQAEIESYYAENSPKYEEFDLRRIVVLKSANSEMKPEQLKALADKIRERAAAGEDPDKLEIEAYQETKSAGKPPSTSLGWKRRGGMDPRHEPQILPLRTGEVSPVMEDGQAYYIYKVDAKRLQPLASVQKDIENSLGPERAKKKFEQILNSGKPQLNDAYFGPEAAKTPPAQQTPPPK